MLIERLILIEDELKCSRECAVEILIYRTLVKKILNKLEEETLQKYKEIELQKRVEVELTERLTKDVY